MSPDLSGKINMKTQEITSEKSSVAQQWRSSGMTQTEYAYANKISIHTLRYWLYKHKGSNSEEGNFLRIKDLTTANEIVLRYPGGVELRLPAATPLSVIKQLIIL
jgi:hypothetical protein